MHCAHFLRCVESILVNLPQFAKSGLKKSLNRCFWYFSLHHSGYFGLVSSLFVSVSVCFTADFRWRRHRNVQLEDRIDWSRRSTFVSGDPFFLIYGEMGKKLLAANSTDSVFAEFLQHRMLMSNCKQRSR